MFYSLFVFRISYKIIVLSSHGYGPGLGLKLAGRAWAKHSRSWSGLGLNSSLRAGLKKLLWAWTLTANCGPGLGSNYRPAQPRVRVWTIHSSVFCI